MLYEPEGHAHLAADAYDPASLLPLTAEFQRELYAAQHPADCSRARFLVVIPGPNGLGSDLHVAGHHLLTAFTHGYVFLWGNASGEQYIHGDPGGLCPDRALNYECFFRPPSSCTLDDAVDWEALASASATPSRSPEPEEDGRSRPRSIMERMFHRFERTRSLGLQLRNGSHYASGTLSDVLQVYNDNLPGTLPAGLLARLRGLGMSDWEVRSWARAQSVGYVARINDATLAVLKASRVDPSLHGRKGADAAAGLPLPLPPGTISAHVRHGDKWKEMKLVPELKYLEAAQRLLERSANASAATAGEAPFMFSAAVGAMDRRSPRPAPPSPLSPLLFVSTEDDEALSRIAEAAAPQGWGVAFSRIPRLNDGPVEQMKSAGLPAVALARLHLGQLLLALEADGWLGTYASNWCRLIEELRGVWVPKVAGPYVEVGEVADYQVW